MIQIDHLKVEHIDCDKDTRTLKSFPDFFKFAQSNGPCPGAKATLRDFFAGAFVVDGGGANELALAGTARELDALGTPGRRAAGPGNGGGGIHSESLRIRGTEAAFEIVGSNRWALLRAGNAGGASSSSAPRTVSVSLPSSSGGGWDTIVGVGATGSAELRGDVSQLRR